MKMRRNFFSEVRGLFSGAVIVGLLVLLIGLAGMPGTATSAETGDVCIGHYKPGATCTANDVRIRKLNPTTILNSCDAAPVGQATMVFEMLVGAEGSPDRYDIGVFLALDGGNAITGNSCFHDYLDPPLTKTPTYGDHNGDLFDDIFNGPWLDIDDDVCGDIAANTQVIKTLVPIQFRCVDTDGDGFVDIMACASWDNQDSVNCTGISDVYPGTKSKCSCEVIATTIEISNPAISVDKTPATQAVISGQSAVFTITVDNTGNVPLSNIIVNDPQCDSLTGPTGDNGDSILQTTETWTYTCTVNNVTSSFTNTVTVTGTPPVGDNVSDSDTADVTVDTARISVIKGPPTQTVLSGGTATFTLTVTNPGSLPLSNIIVNDPQCDSLTGPTGDNGDSILQTTETWTYACTVNNVTSSFTNAVTVTGTPPQGSNVSDSDSADVTVEVAQIAVNKGPATQTVTSGGTATFTITVTNPGTVPLSNVNLNDPMCNTLTGPTGDSNIDGILQTSETWTFVCTVNNVTGAFTNVVGVTATPMPEGEPVTASANANVTVSAPVAAVPTMNEWGMIVFLALAGFAAVYYLRRERRQD